MMLRIFLYFLCAMVFSACALLDSNPQSEGERRTVEHLIATPLLVDENLPNRTLSTIVLLGDHEEIVDVKNQFFIASEMLWVQVGVVLNVTYVRESSWIALSFLDLAFNTNRAAYKYPNADLVIGIGLLPREEWSCSITRAGESFCFSGIYIGNGIILFQRLHATYIVHEIGHAFISLGHSPTGVMTSSVQDPYFSVADRKRFLKRKWKILRPQNISIQEQ